MKNYRAFEYELNGHLLERGLMGKEADETHELGIKAYPDESSDDNDDEIPDIEDFNIEDNRIPGVELIEDIVDQHTILNGLLVATSEFYSDLPLKLTEDDLPKVKVFYLSLAELVKTLSQTGLNNDPKWSQLEKLGRNALSDIHSKLSEKLHLEPLDVILEEGHRRPAVKP